MADFIGNIKGDTHEFHLPASYEFHVQENEKSKGGYVFSYTLAVMDSGPIMQHMAAKGMLPK